MQYPAWWCVSAPLPLLRRFYRLFDAVVDQPHERRLPLSVAIAGAWRIYRDMRAVGTARELLGCQYRLNLSPLARVWATLVLSCALVGWMMPAALPALLLFVVWFRYGLWHLWWFTCRAGTFVLFAVLEILDILAPPQMGGYPALTVPCAAYVVVWAKGRSRRRIVGAALVALILPAAWFMTGCVVLAALVGLVPMSIGAAATVIVLGGCLDRQLTAQRCLRRALIFLCGEVFSWWWPTARAAGQRS
jgi:hypothetical protein